MANNTSGYTSKPSDKNFSQSGTSTSGAPVDNVQDAIGQVIDQIFRALEPRIHEFAQQFSQRAVSVTDQSVRQLVTRARQKPVYTIGAVALLVVGLGLVLGTTDRSQISGSSSLAPHDLH